MAKKQTSVEISGGQAQGIIGATQVKVEKLTIINYTDPSSPPETKPTTPTKDIPNPYRGLFHFGPDDAKYFFGRENFVAELIQTIDSRNFIAVLGASGSGKSSVILAGLVPKLPEIGHWTFTHFRPSNGDDPFHALAKALTPLYNPTLNKTKQMKEARELADYLRSDTIPLRDVIDTIKNTHPHHQILLIADQFEELYTLTSSKTIRNRFLDVLLRVVQLDQSSRPSPITLILTMRADFLEQASLYSPFSNALQGAIKILSPMEHDDLIKAVVEPAKCHEVILEDELVDAILDDVGQEAGKLPLLQFALAQLWQKQNQQRLTYSAYKKIGRIDGALTQHADNVFHKLSHEQKRQARRIFIRLVHPGEGMADTRSIATRVELEKDWSLVQELAASENRLVVTKTQITTADETVEEIGEATVEVIHEALIQNWKRLREWLEEDREFRTWLERLSLMMNTWIDGDRNDGDLLRGTALAIAKDWQINRRHDLSQDEQKYIHESINLEQREIAEREARRQKQLRDMQELAQTRKQAVEQNLQSLDQSRVQIEDAIQEADQALNQFRNRRQESDEMFVQILTRKRRLSQIRAKLSRLHEVMSRIESKAKVE